MEPVRSLMEAWDGGGQEVLPAGTGAKAHPGRRAAPETRGPPGTTPPSPAWLWPRGARRQAV